MIGKQQQRGELTWPYTKYYYKVTHNQGRRPKTCSKARLAAQQDTKHVLGFPVQSSPVPELLASDDQDQDWQTSSAGTDTSSDVSKEVLCGDITSLAGGPDSALCWDKHVESGAGVDICAEVSFEARRAARLRKLKRNILKNRRIKKKNIHSFFRIKLFQIHSSSKKKKLVKRDKKSKMWNKQVRRPPTEPNIPHILPSLLSALGDSKPNIRTAALNMLNTFLKETSMRDMFVSDIFGTVLAKVNPFVKQRLFGWMGANLIEAKAIAKEELTSWLAVLYASVEERSVDVRKAAKDAISSAVCKNTVTPLLDKARGEFTPPPVKKVAPDPLGEASRDSEPSESRPPTADREKKESTSKSPGKAKSRLGVSKPSLSKKKEEELDSSPPFQEERIERASKTRQVVKHNPPPAGALLPPPEPRHQGGNRNTSRPGTGIRHTSAGAVRDNESEAKMQYQQSRSNSAGRAPKLAMPVSRAFTLDLNTIEGREAMERLSDSDMINSEPVSDGDMINSDPVSDSDMINSDPVSDSDMINSDPVMVPITRTDLQQRDGSPESAGNRLTHNHEAHQAVNSVIAQVFSTDTNVSITALGQLNELMKDNEKVKLFTPCIDHLFNMCCMQYRYVLQITISQTSCT